MINTNRTTDKKFYFSKLEQMELERFQVLKSYAESIKTLYEADEGLAEKLSFRIIQYWIFGTEPPKKSNPILLAFFNQIKIPIDKCRNKSQNAVKNWQKVWNQIEIKSKSNDNQTEIKWESNWNQNEIKPKENIKYKNIKYINSINTINSDTEGGNIEPLIVIDGTEEKEKSSAKKEKETYWNSEVNLCLELIKRYNGGCIDGTEKQERQYARNLITKIKKLEIVQDNSYRWQEILELVLKVISGDEYYSPKISSAKNIYYNLATLLQRCKVSISKNKPTVSLQAI